MTRKQSPQSKQQNKATTQLNSRQLDSASKKIKVKQGKKTKVSRQAGRQAGRQASNTR